MYGNSAPFSYSPRGFSQEDLPQLRRPLQQDEPRAALLQSNSMSRPSGKSIYLQRKEYSETLNKHTDEFHVRVEHLFTCEMDGQEMKRLDDCVAKLKRLDTKGRLWPQEMIMEAQGGNLLLSDIESKIELESLPLRSIRQTKAILDSCAYNSLLTITVQDHGKRHPQVFMFQCEETGAEIIKGDLDKAVQRRDSDVEPRRDQFDIRSNLENIIGQHAPGSFQQTRPRPMQRESALPPLDHQPTQWGNREPVERMSPPRDYTAQEEMLRPPDLRESQSSPEVPPEQADTKRNTDILNHILGDLEIFMDKVTAAVNAPSVQKDKGKKKNAKKKKSKKTAPADGLPSWEEYISCLQKIKYGFNLLGQLDGSLTNPSAPDFVHIFFTCLGMIVARYPADLPPTVLSPLLTEATARLLSQVLSPEEDGLWRSLGDPWNIPSSRWPGDNVPPYIPEFYDGWRPPAPSRIPSPLPYQNGPMSRSNSQRRPPDQPSRQIDESHSYSPRAMQRRPEEPVGISAWNPPPPPPTNSREPPLYMRVIYDFVARNNQELSIMKGDVVQVIQKSKQWWLVRNARNEEGNIPQNVLEPMKSARPMEDTPWETRGPVTLDMSSSPAEVKAWLQYKGFSKITVSSLGVLTGKLLLGMTKDEIRTVCPEEGGKVFFQLQAIKSAIALASEPSGQYNSRY